MENKFKQRCDICATIGYFKEKPRMTAKDIDGKTWQDATCPECIRLYSKPLYEKVTQRSCRKCYTKLPASKYFHCEKCAVSVESNFEV